MLRPAILTGARDRIGTKRCDGAFVLLFAAVLFAALSGCASRAADPKSAAQAPVEHPAEPDAEAATAKHEAQSVDPNVVSYDDYRDPLMPMNRFIFGFNDVVSRYALIPLGKGYARVVPDAVDRRIDDFFFNVAGPIYTVNNLLQGKFKDSGQNALRFGINTTIGLLGLFDPAESWFGLERAPADFAETLAHYDAGYGFYLVLPFLGPSDLRTAAGRGVDYFLHPIPYLLDSPESSAILAYGFFHAFAQNAADFEELLNESEDPYVFMRNLHLQGIQRDAAYR